MSLFTGLFRMKSKKKSIFRLTAFLLILLFITLFTYRLFITSDTVSRDRYRSMVLNDIKNSKTLSCFFDNLFRYEVTANSVTTAFTLKNPKSFGIPALPPVLNENTSRKYKKDSINGNQEKTISMLLKKLHSFPKDSLDSNSRITYDLVEKHLLLSKKLCGYSYYKTMLGKTTGAFARLPVTLCEYPLDDREDVDAYLCLIRQVPDYFKDVCRYEKDKSGSGKQTPLFLLKESRDVLKQLINSLRTDDNCFVSTFNDRIKDIKDLSYKDKKKYISNNRYYVNQYVIPAYEYLYDEIDKMIMDNTITGKDQKEPKAGDDNSHLNQSQSKNKQYLPDINKAYGLCSYEKGKEYYELTVMEATGSDRPVKDLIMMTEQSLHKALSDVLYIAASDTDAYLYYCDHQSNSSFHSPDGILEALSLMIRNDYPVLKKLPSYRIKTVPSSLSKMESPAFYMIPRIDSYSDNTIYINPAYTSEENGNLFTTLAHEGFPGHLYQTVYFNNTKPSYIRQLLDYPGYVEGWATYAELHSFSFIDYPKYSDSLKRLYQNDTIISLALSARIDMGVNYEGWTLNDTCHFFEDLGFNSYYASDIYSYVVEAPANYLSYYIGYLEIENIKQEYKALMMEKYTEQLFHKKLLDTGPSDFSTIRKYMLTSGK